MLLDSHRPMKDLFHHMKNEHIFIIWLVYFPDEVLCPGLIYLFTNLFFLMLKAIELGINNFFSDNIYFVINLFIP